MKKTSNKDSNIGCEKTFARHVDTGVENSLSDINKLVQKLCMTEEYFVSLEPVDSDFEESYWGIAVDPDGNERDHVDEFNKDSDRFEYISNYIKKYNEENNIQNLLDVGCGIGALLFSIHNKLNNVKLFGSEVSKYAIQHASKFGTIIDSNLLEHEFESNYFDVITCHHVIEHTPEPLLLLNQIKKLLKPGGLLILATPNFDSGMARLFKNDYRMLHDKTHISLFSNDSMHRFLRDNGFRIDMVDYPYFDTEYFNKKSIESLFSASSVSPPFYGNIMTFFASNNKL